MPLPGFHGHLHVQCGCAGEHPDRIIPVTRTSASTSFRAAVHSNAVYGYGFEGYWRDIGTIRAYYETNLLMAAPDAPFNFYDPKLPIYTHEPVLAGSVVQDSHLRDVLMAEGCRIEKAQITPFGRRHPQPDRRGHADRQLRPERAGLLLAGTRDRSQLRYRGRHPGQERAPGRGRGDPPVPARNGGGARTVARARRHRGAAKGRLHSGGHAHRSAGIGRAPS